MINVLDFLVNTFNGFLNFINDFTIIGDISLFNILVILFLFSIVMKFVFLK